MVQKIIRNKHGFEISATTHGDFDDALSSLARSTCTWEQVGPTKFVHKSTGNLWDEDLTCEFKGDV